MSPQIVPPIPLCDSGIDLWSAVTEKVSQSTFDGGVHAARPLHGDPIEIPPKHLQRVPYFSSIMSNVQTHLEEVSSAARTLSVGARTSVNPETDGRGLGTGDGLSRDREAVRKHAGLGDGSLGGRRSQSADERL